MDLAYQIFSLENVVSIRLDPRKFALPKLDSIKVSSENINKLSFSYTDVSTSPESSC